VAQRRHLLDPWQLPPQGPSDYLTDVLRRLPTQKINQIDSLLPANWKPAVDSG